MADTQGGSITIDGHDVRSFTLERLRRQVSFVLQVEAVLFHATVAANIAYGKPGATRRKSFERPCSPTPTSSSRAAAERLRHGHRRTRRHLVGRSASAHRHRPCHHSRRRHSAARRALRRARLAVRGTGLRGSRPTACRQNVDHDRAPARDRSTCRRHLRAERRRHFRTRHARRAHGLNGLYARLYRMQFSLTRSARRPSPSKTCCLETCSPDLGGEPVETSAVDRARDRSPPTALMPSTLTHRCATFSMGLCPEPRWRRTTAASASEASLRRRSVRESARLRRVEPETDEGDACLGGHLLDRLSICRLRQHGIDDNSMPARSTRAARSATVKTRRDMSAE